MKHVPRKVKSRFTVPLFTANPDLLRVFPSPKYHGKSGVHFRGVNTDPVIKPYKVLYRVTL